MKKLFTVILSAVIMLSAFSSCAVNQPVFENDDELRIVTTIFPIYDWVKNITGSENVIYLNEKGVDLHSFEPTANDIIALSEADVFICIGGESDEWVENAIEASKNPEITVISLIELTDTLDEEITPGMDAHEEEQAPDEHIWLSLKKARECVTGIAGILSEKDSTNAEKYMANADNYNKKLLELDRQYEAAVSGAKRNTLLFADRFPFRYMTEDYGIKYFAAFPGCSAESEASFETMAFLIEKTRELSLPCIIIIDGSDGKLATAISEETGTNVLTLNSCQSVTKDDIADGTTYYSIMEENLKIITEALT